MSDRWEERFLDAWGEWGEGGKIGHEMVRGEGWGGKGVFLLGGLLPEKCAGNGTPLGRERRDFL